MDLITPEYTSDNEEIYCQEMLEVNDKDHKDQATDDKPPPYTMSTSETKEFIECQETMMDDWNREMAAEDKEIVETLRTLVLRVQSKQATHRTNLTIRNRYTLQPMFYHKGMMSPEPSKIAPIVTM